MVLFLWYSWLLLLLRYSESSFIRIIGESFPADNNTISFDLLSEENCTGVVYPFNITWPVGKEEITLWKAANLKPAINLKSMFIRRAEAGVVIGFYSSKDDKSPSLTVSFPSIDVREPTCIENLNTSQSYPNIRIFRQPNLPPMHSYYKVTISRPYPFLVL